MSEITNRAVAAVSSPPKITKSVLGAEIASDVL